MGVTDMATAATLEPAAVTPPAERGSEHYEVVDGVRVELPPMSAYACRIASRIQTHLGSYAHQHTAGAVVTETLFRLPLPRSRNRRPDVAFVSSTRWPANRPMTLRDNAWDVVPEFAVEVVSPTDRAEELMDKLFEYFQAGVRLVWLVFP